MELASRSHTPKGKLSRARILAAAEEAFASMGFHGTGLRDVAAAAGMPLAGVVYHFPKKEALYAAVLEEIAAELMARLGLPLDVFDDAPAYRVRLDAVIDALALWAAQRPDRVRLLLREVMDNAARVAKASRLPLAPMLTSLVTFVAHGANLGILHPRSPEIAVLHVVGALSYFAVTRPTLRRIVGAERERALAVTYASEFHELASRALGVSQEKQHGPKHGDRPHRARARAR
jgi:TetR/AcrR family transcriptional regulator